MYGRTCICKRWSDRKMNVLTIYYFNSSCEVHVHVHVMFSSCSCGSCISHALNKCQSPTLFDLIYWKYSFSRLRDSDMKRLRFLFRLSFLHMQLKFLSYRNAIQISWVRDRDSAIEKLTFRDRDSAIKSAWMGGFWWFGGLWRLCTRRFDSYGAEIDISY